MGTFASKGDQVETKLCGWMDGWIDRGGDGGMQRTLGGALIKLWRGVGPMGTGGMVEDLDLKDPSQFPHLGEKQDLPFFLTGQ